MKLTYPVFIAKNKEDYLIYVPDMDLYTEGSSMAEAMEMARDAIGLKQSVCISMSPRFFKRPWQRKSQRLSLGRSHKPFLSK